MLERAEAHIPPRGLVFSVLRGYLDLRASTRARLAVRPRAGEAYVWLVAAGLLIFSADLVAKAAAARGAGITPGGSVMAEWTTSAMVGSIAFLPAATALAAVPVWLVLRFGFGGSATCWETAAAAAWSALLAAPACALGSIVQAGIHLSPLAEGLAELAAGVAGAAALSGSVWIWSHCVASAHGFDSGRWLFAGTAALGGAGWWAAHGVAGS